MHVTRIPVRLAAVAVEDGPPETHSKEQSHQAADDECGQAIAIFAIDGEKALFERRDIRRRCAVFGGEPAAGTALERLQQVGGISNRMLPVAASILFGMSANGMVRPCSRPASG